MSLGVRLAPTLNFVPAETREACSGGAGKVAGQGVAEITDAPLLRESRQFFAASWGARFGSPGGVRPSASNKASASRIN